MGVVLRGSCFGSSYHHHHHHHHHLLLLLLLLLLLKHLTALFTQKTEKKKSAI